MGWRATLSSQAMPIREKKTELSMNIAACMAYAFTMESYEKHIAAETQSNMRRCFAIWWVGTLYALKRCLFDVGL